VASPYGLNDEELAAIRRLHETPSPPRWDDPVWAYPLMVDVVWLDMSVRPPAVRFVAPVRSRWVAASEPDRDPPWFRAGELGRVSESNLSGRNSPRGAGGELLG
jgi:hypothetical protein